jgi:hypothetical protein
MIQKQRRWLRCGILHPLREPLLLVYSAAVVVMTLAGVLVTFI